MNWQLTKELIKETRGLLLWHANNKLNLLGSEAEDYADEGIAKVWENYAQEKFKPKSDNFQMIDNQFKKYAVVVSKGLYIDRIRRQQKEQKIIEKEILENIAVDDDPFHSFSEDMIESDEKVNELIEYLSQNENVNSDQLQICSLFLIGYSYTEISKKLDIKYQTVVSKLKALRNIAAIKILKDDLIFNNKEER